MPLSWTDPAPGKEGVSHYDHVIAATPLGSIILEWKSWKDYDEPCGQMPWGEMVYGTNLAAAKSAAQDAWDEMMQILTGLSTDPAKEGFDGRSE